MIVDDRRLDIAKEGDPRIGKGFRHGFDRGRTNKSDGFAGNGGVDGIAIQAKRDGPAVAVIGTELIPALCRLGGILDDAAFRFDDSLSIGGIHVGNIGLDQGIHDVIAALVVIDVVEISLKIVIAVLDGFLSGDDTIDLDALDILVGADFREGSIADAIEIAGDLGHHVAIGCRLADASLEKTVVALGIFDTDLGAESVTGSGSRVSRVGGDILAGVEFRRSATTSKDGDGSEDNSARQKRFFHFLDLFVL